MNKFFTKTLLAASLLLFIAQPSLHAADLSVGATAWYTTWDFDWDGSGDIEYDPAFLYGPVLSLSLNPDLSLSFVFLYGTFDQHIEGDSNISEITRYDSDLALNYRISSYFKLFAGLKYIGFTFDPDGKHQAIGPGAGLSAVLPIGGNFFMLGNFSGMYLKGKEEGSMGTAYSDDATEYGVNTSISLAYYIPDSSTTISLGGRYQQVKIDYADNISTYDSMSRFYGATLTAVYTFNI